MSGSDSDQSEILKQDVLAEVVHHFVETARSESFNGLSASSLLKYGSEDKVKRSIKELVAERKVDCSFAVTDVNPHIKRHRSLCADDQYPLIENEPLSEFCVYPNWTATKLHPNLPDFVNKPFNQRLLQGDAQLDFVGFELPVLNRYINDPRYKIQFHDYMGNLGISDKTYSDPEFPNRDKVGLQTFGLGFDSLRRPAVVVFLRYLANLTPEHQQYWNSFKHLNEVKLCRQYYQSSILGEFWENRSIRYAIAEEIRLIREMTLAGWGASIFRKDVPETGAIELTSFLLPTQHNFDRFVLDLDKILSENINKAFFDGKVDTKKTIEKVDEPNEQINKGTIQLLEDWLLKEARWDSIADFKSIVIDPLKKVRALRQKPAHSIVENEFSEEYFSKRKKLYWSIFNSLSNLRRAIQTKFECSHIKVPPWLDDGKIDVI